MQDPATETWRLLPYHCGATRQHVAMSDALVRTSEVPSLWWHSACTPTLVLGPGQRDLERRISASGIEVVRRNAGGTSVFATDRVLGQDVMLPAGHHLARDDVVESYRWLGETWAETLRTLGAEARVVSIEEARSARPLPPELLNVMRSACFGSLSPYEVVVATKKVVGLAQVRRRNGVLLQAGIHLQFDPESLVSLLARDPSAAAVNELRSVAAGLDDIGLGHITPATLMDEFENVLRCSLGVRTLPGSWTDAELSATGYS